MYCRWAPERIRSFRTYPGNAVKSALLLAEVGFIYDGDGYNDEVRCESCYFRKGNWTFDEDVLKTHESASPSCPFVDAKAANHTLEVVEKSSRPVLGASDILRDSSVDVGWRNHGDSSVDVGWRDHGDSSVDVGWRDHGHERGKTVESSLLSESAGPEATAVKEKREDRPASTRYASKIARRNSFANWKSLYPLNRDKMALAGLYATGTGDLTRCFYCGAGIDKWEADDDPWVEQLRLFPCKYVLDQISKDLYDAVMVLKRTNPGKISRSMVKIQKRLARSQNGGEDAFDIELARRREEYSILTRRLHCRLCEVSLVGADGVVFQPCGHFIVCSNCDDGEVCAECGQRIESRLPACLVDVQNSTRR